MKKLEVPFGKNLAYSIGIVADQIAYQGFTFLIFTFYYAIVQVPVQYITIVFIIWSIYNAINDPLLGSLSDRTRTKKLFGGRRRPWMIVSALPLALIMFFLFTPPNNYQLGGGPWIVVYFLFIICLFDTIYTAFSVSRTALYPEIFRTNKAREEVGAVQRIVMVIALLTSFILPTFLIEDMTPADPQLDYAGYTWDFKLTGIIFGAIILVTILINVIWGAKEKPYDELEKKERMPIFKAMRESLTNKKFVIFALCSTMNWFVFGLIPTIMPIYVEFVVDPADPVMLFFGSLAVSIPLAVAFIVSIFGVLFWMFIDRKVGSKIGFILSMSWWAIVLIPLVFIDSYLGILIVMGLNGIGLGGSPYFIDRNISNIADDDEVKTGQRREGSYYGVHALFVRLSTILSMGSIAIVLGASGWEVYDPASIANPPKFGLQSLMSLFPAGALIIGIIILIFFPLGKKEVDKLQASLKVSTNETIETEVNSSDEN
ncbi:MAG: MFS transporter [Asgard group archaeon]|nr:MFS transporter [Asgard group archaeon]